jgi:poly(beta-D-mannuronate) lyase
LLSDLDAPPPSHDRAELVGYRVTNRDAGLFDAGARMSLLRETADPVLRQAIEAVPAPPLELARQLPTVAYVGYIPPFYGDRRAWEEATRDLRTIEEAVGGLAAAFVASGDREHADSIVDLLARWAAEEALTGFHFSPTEPQAWFQLESTLFALGLSYAAVRPFVRDRAAERVGIEEWLTRASRRHLATEVVHTYWCWNNHYYRRALQAAAIGVVAGDHDLFRYGVNALHNALAELEPDGAFPREMTRRRLVVHYQNYALLYLVPLMQLVARQGYPVWDLAPAGRTIHDAVVRGLDLLADPRLARRYTSHEQDLSFTQHPMYFAWAEIYGALFPNSRIEDLVSPYRPVWSRTSIGAATLYFYEGASTSAAR